MRLAKRRVGPIDAVEKQAPILATCGVCRATHFVGPWVYDMPKYICTRCAAPSGGPTHG